MLRRVEVRHNYRSAIILSYCMISVKCLRKLSYAEYTPIIPHIDKKSIRIAFWGTLKK